MLMEPGSSLPPKLCRWPLDCELASPASCPGDRRAARARGGRGSVLPKCVGKQQAPLMSPDVPSVGLSQQSRRQAALAGAPSSKY